VDSSSYLTRAGTALLIATASVWIVHARRGSARSGPELHLMACDLGPGTGEPPWLHGSVERGLVDIAQSLHEWATIQQALRARGLD
jgi:hypothetical protein